MPSPIIGKARRRSPSRPPLRPPALRRRRCPPPRPAGAGDRSPSERTTVLSVVAWLHHEWLDESPYGYIQKWLDRWSPWGDERRRLADRPEPSRREQQGRVRGDHRPADQHREARVHRRREHAGQEPAERQQVPAERVEA